MIIYFHSQFPGLALAWINFRWHDPGYIHSTLMRELYGIN